MQTRQLFDFMLPRWRWQWRWRWCWALAIALGMRCVLLRLSRLSIHQWLHLLRGRCIYVRVSDKLRYHQCLASDSLLSVLHPPRPSDWLEAFLSGQLTVLRAQARKWCANYDILLEWNFHLRSFRYNASSFYIRNYLYNCSIHKLLKNNN